MTNPVDRTAEPVRSLVPARYVILASIILIAGRWHRVAGHRRR